MQKCSKNDNSIMNSRSSKDFEMLYDHFIDWIELHEKNGFIVISKNLVRYRSENNFVWKIIMY